MRTGTFTYILGSFIWHRRSMGEPPVRNHDFNYGVIKETDTASSLCIFSFAIRSVTTNDPSTSEALRVLYKRHLRLVGNGAGRARLRLYRSIVMRLLYDGPSTL